MTDTVNKFEKHILIDSDTISAIDCLADAIPQLSRQQLKQAMQRGAVWHGKNALKNNLKAKPQRLRRAKKVLKAGEQLHFYYDPKVLQSQVTAATLIADEGAYSVWNKPCGMLSQGSKWGDHSAICRWIELVGIPQRQSYLVHRLDRATNGLILVAHQKKAAAKLSQLFEDRLIDKRYRARITGKFPEAITELNNDIDGKQSLTRILQCDYDESLNQSELLLQLATGRKHQIRKHLANLKFPIIGDRLYGKLGEQARHRDQLVSPQPDLQLSSVYLAFVCPISGEPKKYFV